MYKKQSKIIDKLKKSRLFLLPTNSDKNIDKYSVPEVLKFVKDVVIPYAK
jgi:hypothetical protein